MNKIKILDLAMELYPCPPFLGKEIKINIDNYYDYYGDYSIMLSFNCGDFCKPNEYNTSLTFHIRRYEMNLCNYINIDYRKMQIRYIWMI